MTVRTYIEATNQALKQAMRRDSNVVVIGEGVPDPKAIFGSTAGLMDEFGPQRVFDMPLSENGLTGICIGAALTGLRPVLVHQRIDFALLSLDQLVNIAAKWHYMFNGQATVPLVVRTIIGRGWGQGPQHSQSLQALFAQIPGLKVVMPATPRDAKGMLLSAIKDPNPVMLIEHRWLHSLKDEVPDEEFDTPLDRANIVRDGSSITVAAYSYILIEALKVVDILVEYGVSVEVIDMRCVNPVDEKTLFDSVAKTGRLLVLDTGNEHLGISAELIARVSTALFKSLKHAPARMASPNHPVPTSHYQAASYYPTPLSICSEILRILDNPISSDSVALIHDRLKINTPLDIPNVQFSGPF